MTPYFFFLFLFVALSCEWVYYYYNNFYYMANQKGTVVQMNFSWFHKAAQYIGKDTGEPNESPKLIIVIRILVLSMLFYVILTSIIYVRILNNIGDVIFLISFLTFLAIFLMSYHRKTVQVVYTLNLCMLAWIIVNIFYLGWDIGVQHFLLVLLVLCFFSGYSQYEFKAFYAAVINTITNFFLNLFSTLFYQ